jgi:hypothetical protein
MPRPIKFVDGFSESLWKSLVVKALRIGWVAGIEAAAQRLAPSTIQATLLCGIFEDVFPAVSELTDALAEVRRKAFEALCQRETHHGRGLGLCERFVELASGEGAYHVAMLRGTT